MAMRQFTIISFVLLFVCAVGRGQNVTNDLGWSLSVMAGHGEYQIKTSNPSWTLGGAIGKRLTNVSTVEGKDSAGEFRAIRFDWQQDGRRSGSIRLYRSRPIVIFKVTFTDAVGHSPAAFPVLKKLPDDLLAFRYGADQFLRPISFQLNFKSSKAQYGGPFCLFDRHANAMILSPASDFMVAMLSGNQQQGLSSGLNRTLKSVPAGYQYQTILVAGGGINRTWNAWGKALTDLYQKKRPTNDADAGLKYIGYWTDNGSAYYYNYDREKGYAGTLLAVKADLEKKGVPIHYMQLDSWWYPKTFTSASGKVPKDPKSKNPDLPAGKWDRYGGMLTYTPSRDLFPDGLLAFKKKLGLPLITHSRWIDRESPYQKEYKISGVAAVDPKWWDKIIGDIAGWGVTTYEQDWNNEIYEYSPALSETTWGGAAYMDGMADACKANGLTMQYCMMLPRMLMQGGSKYGNLTTVRLSVDRFQPSRWRQFIFGSQMAGALGAWPWSDVFRSWETGNILLSDLSAGMVGLADPIGKEDAANIFQVCRHDGMIVKPDAPLTPTDATYINQAEEKDSPMICAAHGGGADYVFAFAGKSSQEHSAKFSPEELGVRGDAFVYDYFTRSGRVVKAGEDYSQRLNDRGWAYDVVCPVGRSGMALVGDVGMFVTRGRQRIAAVSEESGSLKATVLLAKAEDEVTLGVYARSKPAVEVSGGTLVGFKYDENTGLGRATVRVGSGAVVSGKIDPVRQVEVRFVQSR